MNARRLSAVWWTVFLLFTGNYSKPLNINVFETIQQSAKDKEDMTKLFVN